MSNMNDTEMELAKIIVNTLNLEIEPENIDPEAPLVGEGLGLDSIDLLEMSMEITRVYGVELNANQAEQNVFNSLRALNQFIQEKKS